MGNDAKTDAVARAILAKVATRALLTRMAENPLRWAIPPGRLIPTPFAWLPKQIEALNKWAPGLLEQEPTYDLIAGGDKRVLAFLRIMGFLAGNRAGKSAWAVRCFVAMALGLNPARMHELPQDPRTWKLGPPRLLWGVMPTFERSRDVQQKLVWDHVPRCLIGSNTTWNPKEGFHGKVLPLTNGSRIVFKTGDQGRETFEGDPIHAAWIDEELPIPYLVSIFKRTADYKAPILWTAWPNQPEMHDVLVERRFNRDEAPLGEDEVGYITAGMADNTYLSAAEVELQKKTCDPLEIPGRIYGRFSFTSGLVYPMFSEIVHVRGDLPEVIPADWTRDEIIDPGWDNPCAVLFGAVLPDGVRGVYDEIYVRHRTVGEIAALIYAKRWRQCGVLTPAEIERFYGLAGLTQASDAAGTLNENRLAGLIAEWRARCGDCAPRRTLIDEYAKQRDQAKPQSLLEQFADFGIYAVPASNYDKPGQRSKVREILRPLDGIVRFWVAWGCVNTRWEFKHFKFARPDERAGEHVGDIERVVDANNHAMSCIEYWIASDPQFVPPPPEPPPPGSIMARHLEMQTGKKAADAWRKRG